MVVGLSNFAPVVGPIMHIGQSDTDKNMKHCEAIGLKLFV